MKVFVTLMFVLATALAGQESDWRNYGNDPGGMRYSTAAQINRSNVVQLKSAWTFHTADISDGEHGEKRSGLETTPLMVEGTLYLTTGFNRVIALDPETGKQKWVYDPHLDRTWQSGDGLINRGVATWLDSTHAIPGPCHRRIFAATIDARLLALDAATGSPCADFGQHGQVSLRDVPGFRSGWYHSTSPPAVIDDLVIVGSAIDDNARAAMPSGVVRAFDARNGALRWSWDPISPNTDSAKTWTAGAANAWSIMTVDQARDQVFVPTGSASPDYYGGLRPGDDKWANSVVALHASTGKIAWGFQLVHHDLWDYDSAAPPLLATLPHGGKQVPVVIQGNKTGFLYVLNRDTGKPVFPVEERPVPQTDVPGEVTSPTQPFPLSPPALSPQHISSVWGATAQDQEACRTKIAGLRNEGIFTPPSIKGSLVVPGHLGGMTWSGYSFDPVRNILFANSNNFPAVVRVIPRVRFEDAQKGNDGQYTAQEGTAYGMYRQYLLSAHKLPCVPPPWGMLTAVDMAEGKILWQVPLGRFSPSAPAGAISLGGSIVTAGGLVFIAGTYDPYIRAFDAGTGKELWKAPLPASGHATPMTYQIHGKQYVVIAAGGHAQIAEEPQSDAIIAFALP